MTFENVIFLFIASDGYKRRHVWTLQLTDYELICKQEKSVLFRANVSTSIFLKIMPRIFTTANL